MVEYTWLKNFLGLLLLSSSNTFGIVVLKSFKSHVHSSFNYMKIEVYRYISVYKFSPLNTQSKTDYKNIIIKMVCSYFVLIETMGAIYRTDTWEL